MGIDYVLLYTFQSLVYANFCDELLLNYPYPTVLGRTIRYFDKQFLVLSRVVYLFYCLVFCCGTSTREDSN